MPSGLARSFLVFGTGIFLVGCQSRGSVDPQADLGREIFSERANPACGTCHTLGDAETIATIGPNLDTLKPDSTRVSVAVRFGVGIMPPQAGILTDEEIATVSRYVALVAGETE